MIRKWFDREVSRFKTWWRAPITRKDRLLGSAVGGMGGFWLGVIAFFVFGPSSATISFLAGWAVSSAALGVVVGTIFPKVITVALYPFAITGGGPST